MHFLIGIVLTAVVVLLSRPPQRLRLRRKHLVLNPSLS